MKLSTGFSTESTSKIQEKNKKQLKKLNALDPAWVDPTRTDKAKGDNIAEYTEETVEEMGKKTTLEVINSIVTKKLTQLSGDRIEKQEAYKGFLIKVYKHNAGYIAMFGMYGQELGNTADAALRAAKAKIDTLKDFKK